MAKTLQFRRGTTTEIGAITGAEGELFVDLDKNALVVMDGATQGGQTLQSELVSGTNIKTVNGTSILGSGDVDLSTSLSLNGNILNYTNIDGTVQSIDLSAYLDDTTNTIVSGTLNGNTITFTREDATTFTVDVAALYDDTNLVTSVNGNTGAITVQETLVSGTNIKTVNGQTLLGSGDLEIGGGVEVSDTAPVSPSEGDLWWDSTSGTLKIYYDDGTSQQWVDASPTLSSDFTEKSPIISTPVGTSPATNDEIANAETFTLSADEYFNVLGLAHASSDWQVSTDPAFGTTEVNVSADTSNLTSYEVTGGISTSDTFYWRVRYRDSEGNVSDFSDAIEFENVIPPPELGESYGGGFYFGTTAANGTCYYLIVAPNATGCAQCQWKTTATTTAGTTSTTDGYSNTYGPMDNAEHPAGNWCATRTINGFSDWYLPAIDELETFYNNGANGGNESVIGSGEAFASAAYWSSTEFNDIRGCILFFDVGVITDRGKTFPTDSYKIRAVRREPI